ncbi:hypothetical protein BCR34DRAFT_585068 [Clohesyomyces aquaticus]|uniref:DUF7730 domain-containing protein n=1 Tax=Clohesyomyces aquaticus TaxID=1231657 RepID=A0A1Y1ZZ07_9PLEO|nr:hypothetical protein BCR34DRAFT_585068 [Clohesyomyces aquaticus]
MRVSSLAASIACGPIVCLYVAFAACCCPGRLRRTASDAGDKKRFEQRQKLAPRPLPVRPLERTLTLPSDPEGVANEKAFWYKEGNDRLPPRKTIDQSERSRLMQLPLELRQMIWRHALGDRTMHIILKPHKVGHMVCKAPDPDDNGCQLGYNAHGLYRECCWGTVDFANMWSPTSGADEPTDGDITPLLRTCRQIYSESINFLYSTNTFSFNDLDCIRYFSATILPSRFSLLRSLSLAWQFTWPIYDPIAQRLLLSNPALYPPEDEATWEETWRIISTLPNLEYLRADLLHFDGFRDNGEDMVLKPLWKVTRPKRFVVSVSWKGEEVRDAPFVLVRQKRGVRRSGIIKWRGGCWANLVEMFLIPSSRVREVGLEGVAWLGIRLERPGAWMGCDVI